MKDLTIDNITDNTIRINSQSSDARLTYILERLVTHLHDFARETRLSTKEWMAALEFLTAVGQICSDVRQVGSTSLRGRFLSMLSREVAVLATVQYIYTTNGGRPKLKVIDGGDSSGRMLSGQ